MNFTGLFADVIATEKTVLSVNKWKPIVSHEKITIKDQGKERILTSDKW